MSKNKFRAIHHLSHNNKGETQSSNRLDLSYVLRENIITKHKNKVKNLFKKTPP